MKQLMTWNNQHIHSLNGDAIPCMKHCVDKQKVIFWVQNLQKVTFFESNYEKRHISELCSVYIQWLLMRYMQNMYQATCIFIIVMDFYILDLKSKHKFSRTNLEIMTKMDNVIILKFYLVLCHLYTVLSFGFVWTVL